MRDTLLLIDGNNLAYANYFAHQSLRVQNGEKRGFPTGLLHGYLIALMRLSSVFEHAPMIVVWDGAGKSWRKREYPGYKAHRQRDEKVGREVSMQLNVLDSLLDDLQVPQLRIANVEADDLIGILSRELASDFERVVIRSTDKDFYQLLSDKVQVYRGDELLTAAWLKKEFGVEPKHWCQIRAMSGDATDNLIGLPKVGLITATRLFAAGVRVPVNGNRPTVKVLRFSCDKLTAEDWQRVNQNYRLSKILTRYEDSRLSGSGAVPPSIQRWRERSFAREKKRIKRWALLKQLGVYELNDVAMSVSELVNLF